MKVIHYFAIAVLSIFGVYLLYFNLVMALNVVGSSNHVTPFLGLFVLNNERWTSDYYFGFDSIRKILNDLPTAIRFDYTLTMMENFVESLTGFSGVLQELQNNTAFVGQANSFWDTITQIGNLLFNFGKLFFQIMISPFKALIAFITINVQIFLTIIDCLTFIWRILNGTYNLPISGWITPLEDIKNTNPTDASDNIIRITMNGNTISYY